jgi:hypothetical protein
MGELFLLFVLSCGKCGTSIEHFGFTVCRQHVCLIPVLYGITLHLLVQVLHVTALGVLPVKFPPATQDSLGGNTKTCMVANIGPADWNYDETMSTLRYASRAKSIMNKPKINEDPKDAMLREFQVQHLQQHCYAH